MTDSAFAPVEQDIPQPGALSVAPSAPSLPATGNPLMDMAQQASQRGDVEMLKSLLSMRDEEDARQARQAFNKAFAAAQAEFPIVPKRGRGHNGVQYAREEDIKQAIMPILAKHGLSMRHRADTTDGVIVTATLAHVDGHSETDTFVARADKSGSKNDVQAIKSTITYARRTTMENLLGLASHGEDDDAFSSGGSEHVQRFRALMQEATTLEELDTIRGDLMRVTDMTGEDRALLGKLFIGFKDTLKGASND